MSSTSATDGWVRGDIRIDGKTVIITGANTGIGYMTAVDLAKRGGRIILACRNLEKAEAARKQIVDKSSNENVKVKPLNLASFASIREFAKDVNETEQRLDVLINNAGVYSPTYQETEDGHEMHFAVNHLGHFLLTNLLIDLLKRSSPSRIIHVSSGYHKATSIKWEDISRSDDMKNGLAYAQSKLMNVLFSRELSQRLAGTGVTSNSLDPGFVKTDIFRDFQSAFIGKIFVSLILPWFSPPEKGAQTSVYCAVAPELQDISGKYYRSCKVSSEARLAQSDDDAKRLWKLSEEITETQSSI